MRTVVGTRAFGNGFVAVTKLGHKQFGPDSLDAATSARDSDERITFLHTIAQSMMAGR